jgi:hypothetical protein
LIPATSALYLLSACSINARGEITGLAADADGNLHGYLATPLEAGNDRLEMGMSPLRLSAAARDRMGRLGRALASRKGNR